MKKYKCNKNKCPLGKDKYSEEYDCHYDPKLNIWLEEKCSDPNCQFCKNRPNCPSEITR